MLFFGKEYDDFKLSVENNDFQFDDLLELLGD